MSNIHTNHRKSHGRLKAWLTIASGFLLLISFMAGATYFGILPGIGGLVSTLWSIVIAISVAIVIRGRKMMAVDAASLLKHDKRLPILYLRPFSKDGEFPPQRGLALLRSKRRIMKLQYWTPATYEEEVAHALKKVGPFVAIGNPKKHLPELGAAWMWINDAEWQEKVKELIARSGLIFMQIGESEGFLWELGQVVETEKPHKLILGLPFVGKGGEKARQAQYDNFRIKSSGVLPKPLPEKLGGAQFLYFDEGWSPHLFTPYKSALLPQPASTEHTELSLQMRGLKELHSEFMLTSTPYWFRWMLILLLASFPILFALVVVLFFE